LHWNASIVLVCPSSRTIFKNILAPIYSPADLPVRLELAYIHLCYPTRCKVNIDIDRAAQRYVTFRGADRDSPGARRHRRVAPAGARARVPPRIAARLDCSASPALRPGARLCGHRHRHARHRAHRLAQGNAVGGRTGARIERLRRGARLASEREVRRAPASADRRRRRAGPGLPVQTSRDRRRTLSRGAADRPRHFGRRPGCPGIQAPRPLSRSPHSAPGDAARRARQESSCGSRSG